MIPQLKAEFRKVFSIRSTYIIITIVIALLIIFAFLVSGWQISSQDLHDPGTLAGDITGAVDTVSIFLGLIAIFLMTHEYRYNTIMHTLTLSNSRLKVIVSKILVLSGIAVVFTLIVAVLSPLLSVAGIDAHHLKLVPQTLDYTNLLWRCLFFGWGYTMAGLLIAALVRNQIGAIVTLFIVPTTVEALIGLILKHNTVYLPFTALQTVLGTGRYQGVITIAHAAMVFTGYLIVGWIIGLILFMRRDAS